MFIPIVYPSALQFWLNNKNRSMIERLLDAGSFGNVTPKFRLTHDMSLLQRALDRVHIDPPMVLLASSADTRMFNQLASSKVISQPLPPKSFYIVDQYEDPAMIEPCTVLIASPELCFLQAAAELSLQQLILLGMQLCARFIYDPFYPCEQAAITPITNSSALRDYLSKVKRIHGIQNARRAAEFVFDNSNSPVETMLGMMTSLPYSLGGCCFPRPALNYDVPLSRDGAFLFGKSTCCCDLVWAKEKVVAEYDSNMTHLSAEQHAQDKKKATALTLSGYHVINVTAPMLKDFSSASQLFNGIRGALHVKSQRKYLDDTMLKRRDLFLMLKSYDFTSIPGSGPM